MIIYYGRTSAGESFPMSRTEQFESTKMQLPSVGFITAEWSMVFQWIFGPIGSVRNMQFVSEDLTVHFEEFDHAFTAYRGLFERMV